MNLKCVECGEEAVAIAGGNSYCQSDLEHNRTIFWGEKFEKENNMREDWGGEDANGE